jgi:predicted RNA-binding protein YlxR (DUF448 family)
LRNPPNDTGPDEAVAAPVRVSGSRSSRAKSRGAGDESDQRPSTLVHPERPPQAAAEGLGTNESRAPERTCILTRAADARDNLIRLALSPDGEVLPDVRAKAPGRGAWIGVGRAALEKAQANGKLKGALARAFKSAEVRAPADLGARIEAALRQQALDRLGLEARAGNVVTGAERIEVAARRGEVQLLLHASDAGEDGNRKLDQAWRMGDGEGRGVVFPSDRAILSLALGRQNVVHVALTDRAAAARVRHALERWRAFIGFEAGLSPAPAGTPDASAMD